MANGHNDMVKAKVTFRGFFTVKSNGRSQWKQIPEGTLGELSDMDEVSKRFKTVSFVLENGEVVSAPITYKNGINIDTKKVSYEHFVEV